MEIQIPVNRVRVYLCFYCRYEDEDRVAMRGHFREEHHMRVQVDDESEKDGNENEDDIYDEVQEGGEVDLQYENEDSQCDTEGTHDDTGYDEYDHGDTENDLNAIENEQIGESSGLDSKHADSDAEHKLKTTLHEDQVFPHYQAFQKVLFKLQEGSKIKFVVRSSEPYCGTKLDRLKYPKVKVRFICGYGYQSHSMKSECPVSFQVRLINSEEPSQACYVIKNLTSLQHIHPSQSKPTIISILKTPEKQRVKQEESSDSDNTLTEDRDIGAELSPSQTLEESNLPTETLYKGQVFPNYQVFQQALQEHEQKSKMLFSIRSSEKVDVPLDNVKFPKCRINIVCQQAMKSRKVRYCNPITYLVG